MQFDERGELGSNGARDQRCGEQKRKTGGGFAGEATEEAGGYGDTRARNAGPEGERLGSADRDGVAHVGLLDAAIKPGFGIGPPHDQGNDDQRDADDAGKTKMFFDLFVEELAEDGAWDGADHHVPEEALVLRDFVSGGVARVLHAEAAESQCEPVLPEIEKYGDEGAGVERHVERFARVLPMEQPREKNKVGGAADGQKFGQCLDQGEDDRLKKRHVRLGILCDR